MGGTVGGVALAPVDIGVDIGPGVSGTTIGGSDDSARNVIGDATAAGVHISGPSSPLLGASNNQIINNYIGVGWNVSSSTFTNHGNGTNGVSIAGDHNNILSNTIDASGLDGIRLSGDAATNNLIVFNRIGTNFGNAEDGISFLNAAAQNTVLANTIANNASAGIHVVSGQGNELSGNSISNNGGLGIDLATAGVTLNDNDSDPQAPDYANRGLNFPVLARAIGGRHSGIVNGTLTSTFGDYTIQVFSSGACDSSGYGEGEELQSVVTASVTLTANGQGPASFTAPLQFPFGFAAGSAITAVAIDSAGNTSEFSACLTYIDDTIFADGLEPPPT
jgi:parallel beta-helix repeat protein